MTAETPAPPVKKRPPSDGERGALTAKQSRGRHTRLRTVLSVVAGALALIILIAAALLAANWGATVTAASFHAARGNQTALRNLLYRMPKGADLHIHLSGGIFAERYIDWAAADGLCWRARDLSIAAPPCGNASGDMPMAQAAQDQAARDRIVNALSMRDYQPTPAEPSSHDHFFATFGRFAAASGPHFTNMVADLLKIYDGQSAQYVELMRSFTGYDERKPLIDAIGDETDFQKMLDKLNAAGITGLVAKKKAELAEAIADIEKLRGCGADNTRLGCAVRYNFIAQVSRNGTLADVFVQTALAAALIRAEPRIVGLNFVQAEDNVVALRDYRKQMQIVGFLAKDVPVALHAGELWLGLVPPADLTFHIGDAVNIAGARRIGHGVSLGYERDLDKTLAAMRQRPVAVEINLTSNDMTLDVRGAQHPFPAYRAAGVPVVLSTDDAGVERIDLTNEYLRAARDYGLGYAELKAIARNSLEYAFLSGAEKDEQIRRFEKSSAEFESAIAAGIPIPDGLLLMVEAAIGWR